MQDRVEEFFTVARERHAIYLRRQAGMPRPWTKDPYLSKYRFTNVFRELDATTAWFRQHVREPMRDRPEVLLATVVFRLFNRITTGEAIFLQGSLDDGRSAFEEFLADGDISVLREAVLAFCGDGPYVTGAFIVKTPEGMSKLDGVLDIIEHFVGGKRRKRDDLPWVGAARDMLYDTWSLEQAHHWLESFYFIGHFQAYEIVTDLRHTALLENAPDIMTWANPGPGCTRGLNYLHGRESTPRRQQLIEEMQVLLEMSQSARFWPQWDERQQDWIASNWNVGLVSTSMKEKKWPSWELRDVEHQLCEHYKYMRVKNGGSRPRGTYHRS